MIIREIIGSEFIFVLMSDILFLSKFDVLLEEAAAEFLIFTFSAFQLQTFHKLI